MVSLPLEAEDSSCRWWAKGIRTSAWPNRPVESRRKVAGGERRSLPPPDPTGFLASRRTA